MRFYINIFKNLAVQMSAVNKKYQKPEIEMTPLVRFSLIGLRMYLFILIGLMIYKFISTAMAGG